MSKLLYFLDMRLGSVTVLAMIMIYLTWSAAAIYHPSNGERLFEDKLVHNEESCDPVPTEELMNRWQKINTEDQVKQFSPIEPITANLTSKCNSSALANQSLFKKAQYLKCSLLIYKLQTNKCPDKAEKIKKDIRKCIKRGKKMVKKLTKENNMPSDSVAEDNDAECFPKGSINSQGLIRLCTECRSTKTLDPSRFPRELVEVSCSSNDPVCLVGDGQCMQLRSSVILLRRTGECVFCNGRTKEEWIPEVHVINTGCSCGLRQGSVFSVFV